MEKKSRKVLIGNGLEEYLRECRVPAYYFVDVVEDLQKYFKFVIRKANEGPLDEHDVKFLQTLVNLINEEVGLYQGENVAPEWLQLAGKQIAQALLSTERIYIFGDENK